MAKVRFREERGWHAMEFYCPACRFIHRIIIHPEGWDFNGDMEKPTIGGSVLVRGNWKADGDTEPTDVYCHSLISEGNITYCNDCQHDFVNKTVALPEIS